MPTMTTSRCAVLFLANLAFLAHAPASAGPDEGIATDRPDFVESSNVVGLGRFQIETSVLGERGSRDAAYSRTVSTPTLLRYGIGETIELRLETDGHVREVMALPGGGGRATTNGYADTSLGLKWHLMDDAPGVPSVGLLVHADLASGSRAFRGQGVRPSVRLVGEWELPGGLSLGVMPGMGVDRTDAGAHAGYGILGIVLGKELTPELRGFVEVAAPRIATVAKGGTVATFDTGAAWLLSERCQLDAMVAFGLNRRTPSRALTVGFSFKL
ncbi:transporter [Massilia sp. S19_KUP03_FR1]|uniref:transporter n=1 Tax=Massilia sp. S19_KUP03_FR1 TaxID=3025503 RepID=UPI002FCDDE30